MLYIALFWVMTELSDHLNQANIGQRPKVDCQYERGGAIYYYETLWCHMLAVSCNVWSVTSTNPVVLKLFMSRPPLEKVQAPKLQQTWISFYVNH